MDVGCTMRSPRFWAALCLLLLTASCRLCSAARHGKRVDVDLMRCDGDRCTSFLIKWICPPCDARCVNHDFPEEELPAVSDRSTEPPRCTLCSRFTFFAKYFKECKTYFHRRLLKFTAGFVKVARCLYWMFFKYG